MKDKVVLVTGSSRGIGAATAIAFGLKGAKVIVNYRENSDRAAAVVKKITTDSISVKADVTKPAEVKKLFEEVLDRYGKIDILVNNASITMPKKFVDSDEKHWRAQFDSSFFGAVWCSLEAAKQMLKAKNGKIVNVSSIRGLNNSGRSGIIAYSSAKAALINFTKTLAKEVSPDIQVNSIAPGFTYTENYLQFSKKLQKQFIDNTSMRKWIQPEDVAKWIVNIAEDNIMTGDVIVYDAGYTLKEVEG